MDINNFKTFFNIALVIFVILVLLDICNYKVFFSIILITLVALVL